MNLKILLEKHLPMNSNATRGVKGDVLDDERRKDHYSHFILRLAFCRSEELRRRFVRAESMLFRMRFVTDTANERKEFVDSLDFDWENVSEEEKRKLYEELSAANGKPIDQEAFFKVDFTRVPDLVDGRRVYLRNGKAYVPVSAQISLVLQDFCLRLEKGLEMTARALPRLDEDDRLIPILNHLSLGFSAPEFVSDTTAIGEIKAAQVDELVQHFPLCMRNLHSSLRREKHLKYFSRLQYGLFLKGIGLSVEEALVFWRTAFSTITDDKFNKEYRYNVRHSYGLEGTRRNYKPYSCQQILTEHPPGPGDAHGCPYRTFSLENLTAAVEGMGIRDAQVLRTVKDAVKNRHYHVACTKVFETITSTSLTESINHPNLYFEKSVEIARAKKQQLEPAVE